jgi:autotransporter-associated beta strand protein
MKQNHLLSSIALILAVLAPTLKAGAAVNTWNNNSGNFNWDLTSMNWVSPTIWVDGDDAIFGATGVGTVTMGSAISVGNQTFNTPGYTISGGGGNPLTVVGSTPTITLNADTTNAASINGTNGLTIQGTGTLTLQGDPVATIGNQYTGGTYIKGGTVILSASGANSGGTAYAVDSIEALDTNATVKFNAIFNGSTFDTVRDQIGTHSTTFASHLRMTGGTFDLNDDPKKQHIPVPDGTGLIINTGTNVQAGLIMVADGSNHVFSGVIADGGPLVGDNIASGPTPQGPGRQIGIVSFAASINGGGGVLTLSGSNTYSGSTRIDQLATIKLDGNGTIGFPSSTGSLTGPLRIQNNCGLDLNGHNQTIALMTSGQANGKVYNSAACTVSTLTFGYGNEQANRTAIMQYIDNLGTGGILAMRKVATGPAFFLPQGGPAATNCAQTLSGVNTYSGDTTVAGGYLIFINTTAVSSNSAFRIYTTAWQPAPQTNCSLVLNYSGTAPVRQLWIDGVQQPNGIYGAGTPGIDPSSTGTLTVTGYAPVVLGYSVGTGGVTLSWAGVYKLQAQTNSLSGTWSDYPGGSCSPVTAPIDQANQQVYFRLSTF